MPTTLLNSNLNKSANSFVFKCVLEVYGNTKKVPTVGVCSHRRSGTHLTGEIISRSYDTSWVKSHNFPDELPSTLKWIYVVRNPVDCIYKNFLWWKDRGAYNTTVMNMLDGMSFYDFLEGKAGHITGYSRHRCFSASGGQRDDFRISRGMLYSPIQYWIDHLSDAIICDLPILHYENICKDTQLLELKVSKILGDPVNCVKTISENVGFSPSHSTVGASLEHWSTKHLELLNKSLSEKKILEYSINDRLGFTSYDDWLSSVQCD